MHAWGFLVFLKGECFLRVGLATTPSVRHQLLEAVPGVPSVRFAERPCLLPGLPHVQASGRPRPPWEVSGPTQLPHPLQPTKETCGLSVCRRLGLVGSDWQGPGRMPLFFLICGRGSWTWCPGSSEKTAEAVMGEKRSFVKSRCPAHQPVALLPTLAHPGNQGL